MSRHSQSVSWGILKGHMAQFSSTAGSSSTFAGAKAWKNLLAKTKAEWALRTLDLPVSAGTKLAAPFICRAIMNESS